MPTIPIMYWRYGWHPADSPDGPASRRFEAISCQEAVDKLQLVIADTAFDQTEAVAEVPHYRRLVHAWTAVGSYVRALCDLELPVQVAGPDGVIYWTAPIPE